MMKKVLLGLINWTILTTSCTKSETVVFKNSQFQFQLDSFINSTKKEDEKIMHILLVDESKVFEKTVNNNIDIVYLFFYYSKPSNCYYFYKSFEYRDVLILLYQSSTAITYTDLLEIKKEALECGNEIIFDGNIDIPKTRSFYFDKNKNIIEIINNRRN